MTFSYSAAWEDTVRMLRTHGSLIAAIAGVFIFLPAILTGYFLPPPEGQGAQMIEAMTVYFKSNLPWFILSRLVEMIGTIAILTLLFQREQVTVGAAIAGAFMLLPFYFLTSMLTGIAVGVGFLLLVAPGLYLIGRLAVAAVVVVAEGRRNPIDALQRSIALTKGHGWAVLGLLIVVALAGFVCLLAVTSVVGIVLLLFGDVGKLLELILSAALSSLLSVVLLVLCAAIYRQLSPDRSAGVFD